MIVLERHEQGLALVAPRAWLVWLVGAALVLGGLVPRLAWLDARPLQPQEAAQAYEAFTLYHGGFDGYAAGPLLTNVQLVSFLLFGAAELAARLPGLLAGVGLILLPLLVRRLEPAERIAAAALLAGSSVGVFIAREGASAAPLAFAAGLAAVSAWNAWSEQRAGWLVVCACAVGVGLTADPAFVLSLVVLALAALPLLRRGSAPFLLSEPLRRAVPSALLGLSVSFAASATLLGASPSGLQAGLADLWRWTGDLHLNEPVRLAGWPLDDPLLLAAALAGAWLLLRRPRPGSAALLLWAAVQVLLALLADAPDWRYLGLAVLPLALLGGVATSRGWTRLRADASGPVWVAALLALVPLVFLFLGSLERAVAVEPVPAAVPIFTLAAVALIALYTTMIPGRDVPGTTLLLLASLVLVLLQVRGVAALNLGPLRAGQSLLRPVARLEALADVTATAERWSRADPTQPILVDERLRPLLAWPLRDIPNATFQPVRSAVLGAAILDADAPLPALGGREVRKIPVEQRADWHTVLAGPATTLRWFAARETPGGPGPHAILLVH